MLIAQNAKELTYTERRTDTKANKLNSTKAYKPAGGESYAVLHNRVFIKIKVRDISWAEF